MQQNAKTRLLRLPAELRNRIFTYVVLEHTDHSMHVVKYVKKLFADVVPLLLVCRQIYAETAVLPFAANTFTAMCSYEWEVLSRGIRPAQLSAIRSVIVVFDHLDWHRKFTRTLLPEITTVTIWTSPCAFEPRISTLGYLVVDPVEVGTWLENASKGWGSNVKEIKIK